MGAPNAIERRLDELAERWLAFTDAPAPPVLRWLTAPSSVQMVDAFVAYQLDDAGTLPDLFARFDLAFDPGAEPYGRTLTRALAEGVAAVDEADRGAPWTPPPAAGDDAVAFAAACRSLVEHYAGEDASGVPLFEHLAVVLTPESATDLDALNDWAQRFAVASAADPRVRLLLIDRDDAPLFDAVAEDPQLVTTDPVDLDMNAAYAELATAGDPNDPGVRFRTHFVAMGGALGERGWAEAGRQGEAALAIAREHDWPDQQVAIHLALGSVALGEEALTAGLDRFRQARAAAEAAQAAEHPAGDALVVQTRICEAGALFRLARHPEAGVLYQDTAPLAAARDDITLTLECWRMASLCFELANRGDYAWAAGLRAMQTAETLDAEARRASTLPYVGQSLLRLAAKPDYRHLGPDVDGRMRALVGDDWQDLLEPAPEPA